MRPFQARSTSEQLTEHLREEIMRGTLVGTMPGVKQLVRSLGVHSMTVTAALKQLEAEGIVAGQGPRRCHRIVLPEKPDSPAAMRIAFLNYDPASKNEALCLESLRGLSDQGHNAFFTRKTLVDLQMDVRRISRLVAQTEADAWIVAAASQAVLEWFVSKGLRTFALFGQWRRLPLAAVGPDYLPTLLGLTRRLIGLGHRRIVYLACRGSRESESSLFSRTLFGELKRHGIPTGSYNRPEWEDNPEGFRHLLESLFQHTAPTALVIEEGPHLVATLQFTGQRGIRVPQDLSLACLESRSDLAFCTPAVAHVRWDHAPIVRRMVRWAKNMSRGREDLLQSITKSEYVDGGTIGPVPG